MTKSVSSDGEQTATSGPPPRGRRRRPRRAAVACNFCRQRKARCSGTWPACSACKSRQRKCTYPDTAFPITAGQQHGSHAPSQDVLPSDVLRKAALSYFREVYATTLLWFMEPAQLIEDPAGKQLPSALLLSIIALTAKFIPEFSSSERSSAAAGEYYAELALRALNGLYSDPSLTTVQCCLVLCVHEVGQGQEYQAWLRLGHAMRLAQLLQMHRQDSFQQQLEWGSSAPSSNPTLEEAKRRTFWTCFCLDKLLANGRDRIAILSPEDITTHLPQPEEDFIYGRTTKSHRLVRLTSRSEEEARPESLGALTIRILDILALIMAWHGRGGRYNDTACPWLPDSQFHHLDELLRKWKCAIPKYLQYNQRNFVLVIAAGQARLWTLMFMFYFQAEAYLHREYLPFTPTIDYDPVKGPCDGPRLEPADCSPPEGWWQTSAITMIESATAISKIYVQMNSHGLGASAYPFPGLCLLTAASIHTAHAIFGWRSLECSSAKETSLRMLEQDMLAFNNLGEHWDLAIHWIRQISLFYKLNSLVKHSWSDERAADFSSMDIAKIKDGIMNYIRQVCQTDRQLRQHNLKSTFSFDSWLIASQPSITERTSPDNLVIQIGGQDGIDTQDLEFDGELSVDDIRLAASGDAEAYGTLLGQDWVDNFAFDGWHAWAADTWGSEIGVYEGVSWM